MSTADADPSNAGADGARIDTDARQVGGGDSSGGARRNITIRLTVLARLLRHLFDREMADLNITRSQWGMIAIVARKPGATQRVIAEALEISEASAGRLIDRLCTEGLLERRDRDDDRRARAIYLTPAAEPLLTKLAVLAKSSEERLFEGFSTKDIALLESFLDRVYTNVAGV